MERLQKVMAAAGWASRRACEELIRAGRVRVNGQPAELGMRVDPRRDQIEVDGRALAGREPLAYWMLHKPAGYVTTVTDTHGRPTVMELVSAPERVFPVGRLDMDTEGLLLLTNDGAMAHALLHPSRGVAKGYLAQVRGYVRAESLRQLEQGVELDDGMTAPCRARIVGRDLVALEIKEGRKRQVRRMLAAIGVTVEGLRREAFGPLRLGDLPVGECRRLTVLEIQALRRAVTSRPRR